MLAILHLLGTFVVNLFKSRRRLEIENLFLRHQLNIVLRRAPHRLRLRANDRALLVWMTWLWQASDFQEPYLRHLLGFIGITDVIFIHAEKTAFGPDARAAAIATAKARIAATRLRGNLRSASKRAGFPTPVPTEASPMPTHEGLRADDRDGLEDRWKPSIQLDQEQAITIREPDATAHPHRPVGSADRRPLARGFARIVYR
jgi:hypothetical protein